MSNPSSVLFVCMGNICRSPAAEALFADFLVGHGKQDSIIVDSAGTHGYHIGDLADPRMRKTAARRGFDLQSRARKVEASDLTNFDLVIAMDRENLAIVESLDNHNQDGTRQANVMLFSFFLQNDDRAWPVDVPDPYYGGTKGFEEVLDMIQAGCPAILRLAQSRQNHGKTDSEAS